MKFWKIMLACLLVAGLLLVFPKQMIMAQESNSVSSEYATGKLVIDNQNRYEGMDKAYSDGYVPKVEQGRVQLVVPLICNQKLQNDSIRVALNLGDSQSMPFVNKNYEKTFTLQSTAVNDGLNIVESYVVLFSLELKEERYNGSYPVVLTVEAVDANGNDMQQQFTVYVNISDGKNLNEEPETEATTEEPVTYAPKVLVESCNFSKNEVVAGEEVKAEITLVNTSQTESVQNMTVMLTAQEEYFTLLSQSDTIYVGAIPAGGSTIITYDFAVNSATPQGQYHLTLTMDYADSKGMLYSESGNAKVDVKQTILMQFDPVVIPKEVQVADVVEAQVQAMNLGRTTVYNVRAELVADGLSPEGTIFIGNMEAGTVQTGSIQVSVTSLSNSNSMYGPTKGTITFYYEDEEGNEYTETEEFSTVICSPFSEKTLEEEPDQPGQWWIIMVVVVGILCLLLGYILIKKSKRERGGADEMVEELLADSETK
ncbi:MAG: hypothetical protein J6K43_09150 [Lachnospiraceae bacterium]|nr:hypothetical protein [Lachnospiraceae bacterium]